MNQAEAEATISVLARELDAVRMIAISASTEVSILRARVAELEKEKQPCEEP